VLRQALELTEPQRVSFQEASTSVVAIISVCLLVAYIVHATGSAGLKDFGRALAEIGRAAGAVIAGIASWNR
jgi:hypothetical protein